MLPFTYDYYDDADILELFFSEVEADAALNLTPDITLHIHTATAQPVSLMLNNYRYLTQPTDYGWRTFPLNKFQWSPKLRDLVWSMLFLSPLNEWLTLVAYHPPQQIEFIPLLTVKPRLMSLDLTAHISQPA